MLNGRKIPRKMNRYLALSLVVLVFVVSGAGTARAQSPAALVDGPRGMSPSTYFQLAREADRRYAADEFVSAAEAYARLTEAYPWNGEHWLRLGEARFRLGRYHAAVDAFREADELGVDRYSQWNAAYTALSFARAGEPDSAFVWLERTLVEHRFERPSALLRDSLFAALRQDPRLGELLPVPAESPQVRDEGWRHDLDVLLSEIRRLNPVYSRQPLPEILIRRAERLRERIPSLSDAQIAIEMQHLLTLLGHNHNNFHFLFVPEEAQRVAITEIPLTFYVFPEGLYVVDATAPHEDLIGARVLRFGDVPAERALRATEYARPRENDMELAWGGATLLRMPQVLHAAGIISRPDRVDLSVLDRTGRERMVRLDPRPAGRRGKLEAPRLPGLPEPPRYLSRPDDSFWFETIASHTLYVQFNQVRNKPEESLAHFGLRLREHLRDYPGLRDLIVDVRRNNGGDTYLYPELLRTLIAFDAEDGNRLFVLVGRSTYSATANFITDLDRLTDAIFVGEPSGGKPITYGGDSSTSMLPYSGLTVGLSSTVWQLTSPRDTRLWITPDLPVALTAGDYFANRDPVMEAVLELIRQDM